MSLVERHECEWVRDRLDMFVEGAESDLSDSDRQRVVGHVASCEACARELALAELVRDSLCDMAYAAAPESVIMGAEREISSPGNDNVVRLRSRPQFVRWIPATVAAAVLVVAIFLARDRYVENAATGPEAVEAATREAAVAFAYIDKYARRTGAIVESEVIEQRLLAPVEKAMRKSGVVETKPDPGQS